MPLQIIDIQTLLIEQFPASLTLATFQLTNLKLNIHHTNSHKLLYIIPKFLTHATDLTITTFGQRDVKCVVNSRETMAGLVMDPESRPAARFQDPCLRSDYRQ